MKKQIYLSCLLSGFTAAPALAQYSATLPEAGQFLLTPSAYFQTADEFYIGDTKLDASKASGKDSLDQNSFFLNLEYGLSERFALDASLGWSEASLDGSSTDNGLTDSRIGLRYNLATEGRDWSGPTLSLRAGAIIAGDYEAGGINSIGDGESGWEVALLGEKILIGGLGLYGDFGYRQRANDVPDALYGVAGLFFGAGSWTLSAGWQFDDSLEGGNIGGPGFGSKFGFPQVEEDNQSLTASIGYTDGGGRSYTVFGASTFEGKNTASKNILGLSITIPFGGGGAASAATPVSYSGK